MTVGAGGAGWELESTIGTYSGIATLKTWRFLYSELAVADCENAGGGGKHEVVHGGGGGSNGDATGASGNHEGQGEGTAGGGNHSGSGLTRTSSGGGRRWRVPRAGSNGTDSEVADAGNGGDRNKSIVPDRF